MDAINRVYPGAEGTGAAFLLKGNRAADIFEQNIAMETQALRAAEIARQKQLATQQATDNKFLGSVNPKDYWVAHSNEINDMTKSYQTKAAQVKAAGGNIYTDPELNSMKNDLYAAAKYSGDLYNQSIKLREDLDKNPDNYDEESKLAATSFYNPDKKLADYIKEGKIPPALKPKYTMTKLLNGVKGSSTEYDKDGKVIKEADRSKNVQQVLGLSDTPAFKKFVSEAGGDPSMPAFPIVQNGRTIFSTRDENLLPEAQLILDSSTPQELGLTAQTKEEALPELLEVMKKQNQAYGRVVSKAADFLDAGVDGSTKLDFRQDASNRGWANYGLAKQRLAMQKEKTLKDAQKAKDDENYLRDLKAGIMGTKPEAIDRLNSFLAPVFGKARYVKGGVIIDIPEEDKKTAAALSPLLAPTTSKDEQGKVTLRYKIGNSTGQKGDIILDAVLKKLNLLKENKTPESYEEEFDVIGEETFDDL